MNISSKKMRGLIDFDDAVSWCAWPVAKKYFVYGGAIYPDREAGWKWTSSKPLADPNLFKSFADLGAHGANLPEDQIRRWVSRHGLLRLEGPGADRLSFDNHVPIRLTEFREEARRAHEARTLFGAIRYENYDTLRPRISRKRSDPPGRPGEGSNAKVFLDGQRIPVIFSADGELSDSDLLLAAKAGLEWCVKARIKDVEWDFDHHTGHPQPEEVYRPKLIPRIPDLRSAIWFQFALLMSDTRSLRYCEICGEPIEGARRDRKTCTNSCRTIKSRRNKTPEDSA